MRISNFNNNFKTNNEKIGFTGIAEDYRKVKRDLKLAIKTKAGNDVFEEIAERSSKIAAEASRQIKDTSIPRIFPLIVKED